jgi:uncharacterized lipoprotein YbaY
VESEKQDLSVAGRILIAGKVPAFRGASAHLYLEDVSRADAESVVIAQAVVKNVNHSNEVTEIPFRLKIEDRELIDPKNYYSVRVWIDTDGDGKPSAKDLFSDRAYRVLTRGFKDYVEIEF